ncbi:MAG: phytanoyl-CoA dioxygenase family protein [Alphaproteobacteria bacterium]|nr:phytanoyl-CoA dioxygenase family protein [Alphaproteobacteria bacterium]
MSFPKATEEQIRFFREHGYLIVEDAIPQASLDELEGYCDKLLDDKQRYAFDWAWDAKEKKEERSFKIVQSSPSLVWGDIDDQPYRKWLVEFGSALIGSKQEFWYDQFLGKPPGKSSPTYWHQDEGYWGRNLRNKGLTCWIPLQDVNAENGCMHFIDGGHTGDVLVHRRVEGVASDLLTCDPDESKLVVAPIKRGSVTFHHSNMPHMTTANISKGWRKAISNHMQEVGAGGEGDHYPWKVYVNQRTGKLTVPETVKQGVPADFKDARG